MSAHVFLKRIDALLFIYYSKLWKQLGQIEDHAGWTAISIASAANRHFFEPIIQKDMIHTAIAGVSEEAGEVKRRL